MKTLTKNDLINILLDKTPFSKRETIKIVDELFEVMIAGLENGDSVQIPKLGTFMIRHKNQRVGRNPKTKLEYAISARSVVSFKPSTILKATINNKV
jgi:integration host factor subunit alpha